MFCTGSFRRAGTWVLLLFPLLLPYLVALLPFPELESLESFRASGQGVGIADRHGRLLASLPGPGGSFMIRASGDEIPRTLKQITVALEDKRFYSHPGVDPLALDRALVCNLARGRVVSGASTITMQLARILHSHGPGVGGKLREALHALRLEAGLSKEEILFLYLNTLPFGYNTRGVGAAAMRYFDRPLEELDRGQLLLLASIPEAPALYDPFRRPEALRVRALASSRRAGVPAPEIEAALKTVRRGSTPRGAAHFLQLLREEVLPSLPPACWREASRLLTTLDLELTQAITARMNTLLEKKSHPGLTNAAFLVLDNRSHEVLAWVGSRQASDPEGPSARDGIRERKPSASTLKPFLYALALERGYTAASLLPDLPLAFGSGGAYRPQNFDRRSRGLVRLRSALASSLNVPAVFLLSQIGLDPFLRHLEGLGFFLPPRTAQECGLGAAIGNVEVSLFELTRAFSVFPCRGLLFQPRFLLGVKTLQGAARVLPAPEQPARLYSTQTAWLIRDILCDPAARASGFGTASRLNGSPAMFKSGTASDYTAFWCLGAGGEYTVGVWAGSFEGRPAYGTTGSSLPASLAVWVLQELAGGTQEPAPAAGLAEVRICTLTGQRASELCPSVRDEYFQEDRLPKGGCSFHRAAGSGAAPTPEALLATGVSPRILFPLHGSVFYLDPRVAVQDQRLRCWVAAGREERLQVFLDGRSFLLSYPFSFELLLKPGAFTLKVHGARGQDLAAFEVR